MFRRRSVHTARPSTKAGSNGAAPSSPWQVWTTPEVVLFARCSVSHFTDKHAVVLKEAEVLGEDLPYLTAITLERWGLPGAIALRLWRAVVRLCGPDVPLGGLNEEVLQTIVMNTTQATLAALTKNGIASTLSTTKQAKATKPASTSPTSCASTSASCESQTPPGAAEEPPMLPPGETANLLDMGLETAAGSGGGVIANTFRRLSARRTKYGSPTSAARFEPRDSSWSPSRDLLG